MAATHKLRITGAAQIVAVCDKAERGLFGAAMKNIVVYQSDGSRSLSAVVGLDGLIAAVGYDDVIDTQLPGATYDHVINANGKVVLPGLVDAHTHPVWVGDRVHEFAMKLSGATYMDIHSQGGGIGFTVERVKRASEDELYRSLVDRLWMMLRKGTTLVEAKSGYGLDLENEVKMLRAIELARKSHTIHISSTYCGAHSIPKGSTLEEATDNIIQIQIPAIKDLCEKGDLHVDSIDVFCEQGVFDQKSTVKILKAGIQAGMAGNFHGDELTSMKSGEVAAEVGARCVSHLEKVTPSDIDLMSTNGVIGVLLPTTAYILRLTPPPARDMISKGMAIALGSDFNPNAYCLSMPMVMHLSCILMHMTLEEVLVGATINAAAALGKADKYGSIEPGKFGNLLIINAPRWEHLIYQFGNEEQLISHVIIDGEVVVDSYHQQYMKQTRLEWILTKSTRPCLQANYHTYT